LYRHTWGVVGSLETISSQMFSWLWQWNKFGNRSIFDEVEEYKSGPFLDHPVCKTQWNTRRDSYSQKRQCCPSMSGYPGKKTKRKKLKHMDNSAIFVKHEKHEDRQNETTMNYTDRQLKLIRYHYSVKRIQKWILQYLSGQVPYATS